MCVAASPCRRRPQAPPPRPRVIIRGPASVSRTDRACQPCESIRRDAGTPVALRPGMPTAPRQIIPGRSYLLTRCCSERRFLLKPSGLINAIVLYALAHYASRHGILVHGFCVLSNHYHLVATDVRGVLPDFLRDLNGVLARAVNQAR